MILLWTTKPSNPASALIRWGLSEPMSHFATAFYADQYKGIVLEQRMIAGFDVSWLPYFRKSNKIVYVLEPKSIPRDEQRKVMAALMNEFSGTNYDDGGFLYFAWRTFLLKFFKKPLSGRGEWGDKKDALCTGHARILYKLKPEWFSTPISDFDIVTPGALFDNMVRSNHFIDRTAVWQN